MYFLAPFLEIRTSPGRGLGVFSLINLEPNTLLEISPVICLSEKDTAQIHKTHLHDYYFSWGEDQKASALALGYISLYNHAAKANCYHECDFVQNSISIYTKYAIKSNEELFINYNMEEDKSLWFDAI